MYRFIHEINKNEVIVEIFEDMDRTITGCGEFWLVFNQYILNSRQISQICDERISAMVKLMPNSTRAQMQYLHDIIEFFSKTRELVLG